MERTIEAIRFKLIQTRPYLATAVLNLRPYKSDKLPTLAVSPSWRMYYNPNFLNQFTLDECAACVEHELWHLLRQHYVRMGHHPREEKEMVNIANDLEINDDLPGLPNHPPTFVPELPSIWGFPDGETCEQYYERLKKMAQSARQKMSGGSNGTPQNCGSGAHGQPQEWEEGDDPPMSEIEQEAIRTETAEKIRAAGNVPGGLKIWAEAQLKPPHIPWEQHFTKCVRSVDSQPGFDERVYSRVNRRHELYFPLVMPVTRTKKPEVGVVVDSSGSMMGEPIQKAVATVSSLLAKLGKRIYIFSCDVVPSKVQQISTIKMFDMSGGGGTDMRVGLAQADKLPIDMIVLITDGETPWPDKPPKHDLIICHVQTWAGTKMPLWAKNVITIPVGELE